MDERKKHTYQVIVIHGLTWWGFIVKAHNEAEAWIDVLLHSKDIQSYYEHRVRLVEW